MLITSLLTTQTFHRKLQGLLTHAVSARPSRPEWETKLYTDPNLKMHPRLSRLATSASSDGLILKDLPRVYAPFTKFTDEDMVAPDHAQRLEKRTVFCVWHFGDDGVGHPETVHGGCIAMAFDESFGHAFMSRETKNPDPKPYIIMLLLDHYRRQDCAKQDAMSPQRAILSSCLYSVP